MREIFQKENWEEIRRELSNLSLGQLRFLATKVGINFIGGNESVKDTNMLSAKDQFIMVLDEANRDDLLRELKKII